MAEKIDKNDKAAPVGGPKKKNPLLLIFAAVAVVALIATFVVGKNVSAKSHAKGHKAVEHGPIMPLDEFLVNLADPGGDHFLKVSVDLELSKKSGKTAESLKEMTPVIRDAVLASLNSRSRKDVSSGGGRDQLKADIMKQVNAALGADDVTEVYFSDFVTQ